MFIMLLVLSLLSAVSQASDHSHVLRAVAAIQERNEVFSSVETDPSTGISATLTTWRLKDVPCPRYPGGVAVAYTTTLNGMVSGLMVGIGVPGEGGRLWTIQISDLSYTGLDGLDGAISEVRVEVGYPAIGQAEGQAMFDNALACVIGG